MTLITKHKFLWTFLFALIFNPGLFSNSSSTIKELEAQLKELTSETEVIDLMVLLSGKYHKVDINKTHFYAQSAYDKAKEINYQKGIASSLNKLAIYYNQTGDRQTAIEHNLKAYKIAKLIKEDEMLSLILNNLGYAYFNLGMNDKALEYYFEALPYAEIHSQDRVNVIILENITNVFNYLQDEKKASLYYKKAGEVARMSSDSLLHYIPDLHSATKATKEEKYEIAQKHYSASLDKTYNVAHRAYVLRRLAYSYKVQKKYSLAKTKIEKAIELYYEIRDVGKLIEAKFELVQLLNEMSQYDEALLVTSDLLTNYKEENSQKSLLLNILEATAIAQQELGKSTFAIENYKLALTLKDSIFDEQRMKIINKLDVKYNLKEKEKENYFLRAQKEKSELIAEQKNKIVIFTTLFFLLATLVSLLLYRANKQKNKFNEKLSEQVDLRTLELQKTNLQLKESNIELERFTFITSHDLKEPLRNITSFSQLLERNLNPTGSNEALFGYADNIQKNAKQMNNLIEDILEFSREGSQNLSVHKVETIKVLEEVERLLSHEINKKNARILYSESIPEIYSHRTQLLIVLKNLIFNGIKFNQSEKPQVDVVYKKIEGFHQFSVNDNGIGIDKEYQEYIFEMFKRLHNRNDYEGSGLGLALCRKIVNKMGGKIWLNQLASGSSFCFTIPLNNKL